MMDILNYPTLRTLARVLMTAPAGIAVKGVIDRFHELESCVPDAGQMILQSIQYESYQALTADACAMALCKTADNDLTIALHGAEVLEEVREGTACDMPTGEAYEMSILTPELREKWYGEIASEEEMEALVFSTMESVMSQTHNLPLALEVVQYLVAYRLAAAVWRLPGQYPRKETGRTAKLAKYAIPWTRRHSPAYICNRGGEVFLLDGEMDDGSCEDYLNAIRQVEQVIPHEELKRCLVDRTAMPCFDLELELAVSLWLGAEKKHWGRPVEPAKGQDDADK